MSDIKFGIHSDQPAPRRCTDCSLTLPKPVYGDYDHPERKHVAYGHWFTECVCGATYLWQNPWEKHHRLPLWELTLELKRDEIKSRVSACSTTGSK